jgi:hypothetical protein
LSHLPATGDSRAWLQGGQACAEVGHKEEFRSGPDLVLLSWWSLPFSQEWWGHIRYRGLGSLVVCRWREEGRIRIHLGHNRWPVVPGVWDPIVAPEPYVEQVVRVVYLMGGKLGTDMSLRVQLRDLVVRPWGWSLDGQDSESCGDTHCVAPEATAKLKALAEAKFHMYCFDFH